MRFVRVNYFCYFWFFLDRSEIWEWTHSNFNSRVLKRRKESRAGISWQLSKNSWQFRRRGNGKLTRRTGTRRFSLRKTIYHSSPRRHSQPPGVWKNTRKTIFMHISNFLFHQTPTPNKNIVKFCKTEKSLTDEIQCRSMNHDFFQQAPFKKK